MPFMLKFAIYQCECGEIFKKKQMLDKHCRKWHHFPWREYTVIAKISRPDNRVEIGLFQGKAENGYR